MIDGLGGQCSICDNESVTAALKKMSVTEMDSSIGTYKMTEFKLNRYCFECFQEYGGLSEQ